MFRLCWRSSRLRVQCDDDDDDGGYARIPGATTVIVALVFLLIMEGVKDPGVSLSVGACKWLLHFYLFK